MKTTKKSYELSGNSGLTPAQQELIGFVRPVDAGEMSTRLERVFDVASFHSEVEITPDLQTGLWELKQLYKLFKEINLESLSSNK